MSLPPLLHLALLLYMVVVLAAVTLWFALTLRRGKRKQGNASRQRHSEKNSQPAHKRVNGRSSASKRQGVAVTEPPPKPAMKPVTKSLSRSVTAVPPSLASTSGTQQAHPARASQAPSNPVSRATKVPSGEASKRAGKRSPSAEPAPPAAARQNTNPREPNSREAKRAMMKARANLRNRPRPQDLADTHDAYQTTQDTQNDEVAVTPEVAAKGTMAKAVTDDDAVIDTAMKPTTTPVPADTSSQTNPPAAPEASKRRLAPVRTDKLIPTVPMPPSTPSTPPNALRPAPKHSTPRPSPHNSPHNAWPRVVPAHPTDASEGQDPTQASSQATQNTNDNTNDDAFGAFDTWLDKDRDGF